MSEKSETTMTQINPPFDGSAPCPMCRMDVRSLAAYLHNAFVRWGEPKMFVKLSDLRRSFDPSMVLTVPHPATEALVALVVDIIAALDGMTESGFDIRWTQEVSERIMAMRERFKSVLTDLEPLSDAHFDDERHSAGRNNMLWSQAGGRSVGYGTPYNYNYTVDAVPDGGDIVHTVCGTRLKLHDHFKERLARDPAFYGEVKCPICGMVPFAQFALVSEPSQS